MNQLEHLRALRDKARVQTEQAKAVLKQQGEITESLDRLIAALEGKEDFDFSSRTDSLSLAKGAAIAAVAGEKVSGNGREREGGRLVQMIAMLDKKNGGNSPIYARNQNEIVWVDEVVPILPPIKKVNKNRALPKLEPIVWEVANVPGYPASTESLDVENPKVEEVVNHEASVTEEVAMVEEVAIGEVVAIAEVPEPLSSVVASAIVASAVGGFAGAGDSVSAVSDAIKSNQGTGVKFKFLKFGTQPEETPVEVPAYSEVEFVVEKASEIIAPSTVTLIGVNGGSILSDSEVPVSLVPVIKNDFSFVVAKEEPVQDEKISMEVIPNVVPVFEPTHEVVSEQSHELEVAVDKPIVDDTIDGSASKAIADLELPSVVIIAENSETKIESDLQSDDTVPISPTLIGNTSSSGISVQFNETADEVVSPAVKKMANPSIATSRAVSSNIFFDANSAYLKESELTKLQAIAAAVSGSEARIVKIQGLEDLASSNDFKALLASRRALAVKKKLAEKGVGANQLSVNEIKLSDDGRVLDPASISIVPV